MEVSQTTAGFTVDFLKVRFKESTCGKSSFTAILEILYSLKD